MSLQACADIVARGDPDRFAAAMAAPVAARRVLFPLYAFNVEVARAPWVTSEPMIGEMRLQWWRDALTEAGQSGPVRKHEVTTPLAEIIDAPAAEALDRLVAARRWDLYRDPFEDAAHFDDYIRNTGGTLMWVAAHALGAPETFETMVRSYGEATAFVRFMAAVPALEAQGRQPLRDRGEADIAHLAERVWQKRPTRQALLREIPKPARAALLEGWQTQALLAQIMRDPARVLEGRVGQSEFRRRVSLMWESVRL